MSYFDDEKENQPDDELDEETQDESNDEDPEDEDLGLDEDEEAGSEEDEEEEPSDDEDSEESESDDTEEGEEDDDSEGDNDKDTSAIIQKKKWRKRAIKAERKLRDLQNGKKAKPAPAQKKSANVNALQERNDFRMDFPQLKTKEVDEIEAFAKAKGVSLREALKYDVIKLMIRRNAQKRKAAGSSFDPSRRSQPTKPQKDWTTMSRSEMEAEAARRVARAEAARNR